MIWINTIIIMFCILRGSLGSLPSIMLLLELCMEHTVDIHYIYSVAPTELLEDN